MYHLISEFYQDYYFSNCLEYLSNLCVHFNYFSYGWRFWLKDFIFIFIYFFYFFFFISYFLPEILEWGVIIIFKLFTNFYIYIRWNPDIEHFLEEHTVRKQCILIISSDCKCHFVNNHNNIFKHYQLRLTSCKIKRFDKENSLFRRIRTCFRLCRRNHFVLVYLKPLSHKENTGSDSGLSTSRDACSNPAREHIFSH